MNGLLKLVGKNSATILTCMGAAGLVGTAISAGNASIKAFQIVEKERECRLEDLRAWNESAEEGEVFHDPAITKADIFKMTWKCFIPTIIIGGASIACIVGANSVNLKKQAAILSAYALTETAFKDYQHKVVEILGDKKAEEIREEVIRTKMRSTPIQNGEIIVTNRGEMLCYDMFTGRYFKSDIEALRRAENEINALLLREGHLSLNDVYYAIGLSNIKSGDEIGWDSWHGLIEFKFSSQLTDEGVPCLVMDYVVGPSIEGVRI